MDISKYIGLYLVKNGYCSLPSLGTLQLDKKGAKRYNATTVEPPVYNISFNNVGSIDDKFPHFIAINENISTNNASNAISVFGKEVKEEIANNRPFVIEGLGRFINANGKVEFQQVSDLDLSEFSVAIPEAPPTIIDNTRVVQNDKELAANLDFKTLINSPVKESSFNIGKVILPIGLLALISVGGYFGLNYLKNAPSEAANTTPATNKDSLAALNSQVKDTVIAKDTMVLQRDSATVKPADTSKVATAPVASGPAMKIAILTYPSEVEANVKAKKLATNKANITSVQKADSTNFHVVINLASTDKPAALVIDSLRTLFNPGDKKGKVQQVR
jgi:hypothetical protein